MSCKANSLILINLKILFDACVEEERDLYDLDTGTITTKLDADLLFCNIRGERERDEGRMSVNECSLVTNRLFLRNVYSNL